MFIKLSNRISRSRCILIEEQNNCETVSCHQSSTVKNILSAKIKNVQQKSKMFSVLGFFVYSGCYKYVYDKCWYTLFTDCEGNLKHTFQMRVTKFCETVLSWLSVITYYMTQFFIFYTPNITFSFKFFQPAMVCSKIWLAVLFFNLYDFLNVTTLAVLLWKLTYWLLFHCCKWT